MYAGKHAPASHTRTTNAPTHPSSAPPLSPIPSSRLATHPMNVAVRLASALGELLELRPGELGELDPGIRVARVPHGGAELNGAHDVHHLASATRSSQTPHAQEARLPPGERHPAGGARDRSPQAHVLRPSVVSHAILRFFRPSVWKSGKEFQRCEGAVGKRRGASPIWTRGLFHDGQAPVNRAWTKGEAPRGGG